MNFLDAKQILLIHSILIEETGGSHGVRDMSRILAVEDSVKQPCYKNVYEKAAAYVRGIIQDHPFVDGNKRTGITTGAIFLELNDVACLFRERELEDFAVRVATDNLMIQDIAAWLQAHEG